MPRGRLQPGSKGIVPTFLTQGARVKVAASPSVTCVRESEIDPAWIEKEKKIESASDDLQGKPANIVDKIVTGRINKLVKTKLLLEQPYIRGEIVT